MRRLIPIVTVVSLVGTTLLQSATDSVRIRVGPNILVSRDGNFPHVELMVAANPKNPRNLVGAAITATRADGGMTTTVYASADGGYTWTAAPFRDLLDSGGGDPQVAFGRGGTAYFATLANVTDDTGRTRSGLHVYRSEDGGRVWGPPADLGYSYDHEQIVADQTLGRHAGRIYLGALYGYPIYRVGVFRSDDDGRTFVGPVEVSNGRGELGINVANMLVLSDGTLVVPYADFEFMPERRKAWTSSSIWLASSEDGGVTFSGPRKIATQTVGDISRIPRDRFQGFPMFAVDNFSEPFRDRLYCTWNDLRSGHPQILFTYSADRGRTWSEPRAIGIDPSLGGDQFQPSLAVNRDGILAIAWFNTHASARETEYDEYFAASADGGATFSAPKRISSESSMPLGLGNVTPTPSDFRTADSWRINLLSAASRWGNGGDYMGLTADARGVFHPFWADSRSGTFQIWTAAVQAEVPNRATTDVRAAPQPLSRAAIPLNSRVQLVYDPTRYDPASHTLEMPVRLKNASDAPIYPPVRIEIVKFGSGPDDQDKENSPQLLNASNGRPGDGATFDYSKALGDFESLEPGAQTAAVVWRMRLVDPLKTPNVHIRATGWVEKP